MKTKEELAAIKEEVEALNKKLAELTDDELAQVVGGTIRPCNIVPTDSADDPFKKGPW